MKTYHWFANRMRAGLGLRHFNGTVEAHTVKEAWQKVNPEIADYARQGLVKGEFKLSIRSRDRWYADREVYIHSTYPAEAIANQ